MDLRASLGNDGHRNTHKNNPEDRWEHLIDRGAFYCGRCDQAWLLIAVDESAAHVCKNCGDPLARLVKGRPVIPRSRRYEGEEPARRIA